MPYMQRFLLGFCSGAMILTLPWHADELLPWRLALCGAAGAGFLLALAAHLAWRRGDYLRLLTWAGIPLGLIWSALAHDTALGARLIEDGSGVTVTVTGQVIDEPVDIGVGRDGLPARRFQALITSQSDGVAMHAVGARVRLSWYGAPELAKGEVWEWTAVLKGPWSYANPGGFDYERWLLAAGLQGTGYVRGGKRLHAGSAGVVDRARGALVEQVRALDLAYGGVLLALLIGYAADVPEALWETFRVTGTIHLMVISGLHVSLAAALGFAGGRLGARLCPLLPLWLDVRLAGCLTGSAVALVYVMLAGAELAALRALVMSGATLALLARGRTSRLGSGLLIALAVLLALEPLAIHQQGFWLSFGAVAILYMSLGHRHGGSRTRALLWGQLALSVGMLPLVALTTGALPWTGMPANLLAVPVMSLLTVPAVLLAGCLSLVSSAAAGWVFWLADRSVAGVLWWLDWLALAPVAAVTGSALALAVAQTAAFCWLLGAARAYLPALLLCWALPLAAVATGVSHGEYRIIALDVGQGTAIVVDTRRHRLLYDAGPAFPSGFETGSAVVIPSLAATGPRRLDTLILSHDDVDHSGGAEAVRASLAPGTVLASFPEPHAAEDSAAEDGAAGAVSELCHRREWRWDGVVFRVLDVERPPGAPDNDRSCILVVDDGRRRTLMAGDISTRVEASLLRVLDDGAAPVHLMFAPHHGSRSSSSTALVRVVHPRLVVVSAGRGNRFGHPHPEVVARYQRVGARVFQTGREGALIWHSGFPDRLIRWRRDRAPYWRARDSGGS